MQFTRRKATKKALLIVRRAINIFLEKMSCYVSELIFLRYFGVGVDTLLNFLKNKAGCQGFTGPYPSTFLNK